MSGKLIYFDNAATGYPKPECVRKAAYRAFEECGGNPGRSGHILSVNAAKAVFECRESICKLLNFNHPERIVFAGNATLALNIAIKGLSKRRSHIIISNLEHNSVYRPVYSLSHDIMNDITYSVFDATPLCDEAVLDNFRKAIRHNTKMAVITAASNICGKILPIKEIVGICREKGIIPIIDASQACGEIRIDYEQLKPCVICSAGHKGLYGPTGTGFVLFAPEFDPIPVIHGGNGLASEMPVMGNELPEMLEAGTLNTFGICGLRAGVDHVIELDPACIFDHCAKIERSISMGLAELGADLYSEFSHKTPIVLFNIPGIPAEAVSAHLDERLICTRSGIHCAPLAHHALDTGSNGAVRVSIGFNNTLSESLRFLDEMKKLIRDDL